MQLTKKNRLFITIIVALLVWSHVIWDHFHGGIPVHYLFMNENMPPMPNWMGAIILPFFTWFLLHRIEKRSGTSESFSKIVSRFFAAAAVAISIAICFTLGVEIPGFILLSILGLGLFFPLYKSEFLLGWVLGSSFTFGAMIPMLVGSLFALFCFLLFILGSFVKRLVLGKT